MDAPSALVYEVFLETFLLEKKKKKELIILTVFYIFNKSSVKIFLK